MMDAATCFTARIETQSVDIPRALQQELHLKCLLPYLSIFELWDRLMAGCAVLDKHGEVNAPDRLWQRWEAIFIAWHCCWEAMIQPNDTPVHSSPAPKPKPVQPSLIGIRRKGN